MRKLGTIDLEILHLAIKTNGTFNETHLENSELKRLGVGRILDALASLKDRKMIILNNTDGSFSITDVAREILWTDKIPIWAKILRLLHIKSCSMQQITEILGISEEKISDDLETLRKNQFVLMSPQRIDEKVIKIYEILPEGIEKINKTETEGFDEGISPETPRSEKDILELVDEIVKDIKSFEIDQEQKEKTIKKLSELKQKLEI